MKQQQKHCSLEALLNPVGNNYFHRYVIEDYYISYWEIITGSYIYLQARVIPIAVVEFHLNY